MSNKHLVRSRTHFDPFCWVKSQVKWLNLHFVSGFKASITWNPQFWWSIPKFSWLTPHFYMNIHLHHVSCGCFNPHFLPLTSPKNGTKMGRWLDSVVLPDPYGLLPCLSALCLLANAELNTSAPKPGQDVGPLVRWRSRKVCVRFSHKIWGFSNPQKDFEESFTIVFW